MDRRLRTRRTRAGSNGLVCHRSSPSDLRFLNLRLRKRVPNVPVLVALFAAERKGRQVIALTEGSRHKAQLVAIASLIHCTTSRSCHEPPSSATQAASVAPCHDDVRRFSKLYQIWSEGFASVSLILEAWRLHDPALNHRTCSDFRDGYP